MNVLPGEPVPPGFEDEANREPEIQSAIDQYKGNALIGLEYTVEIHEEERCEPGYFCVLCDKRGDPRTIMQHWTSFNHRLKYLEKHFPAAVREFNPVKYKPNSHNIMIIIVQNLSEAIEDHHGRLPLSVVSSEEMRQSKHKIIADINGKFHYDECNGPNFLNIIDRSLWEKNMAPNKLESRIIKTTKRLNSISTQNQANRDGLDEISSESDGGAGTMENGKKLKKREQSPAYRVLPRVRRSPPFEDDRGTLTDKKLPTPKELSIQASHIAQERYKWEKYRCMLEIQLNQMEKMEQDFEKNPEKHPLYPDEWKKFWNRRYKELQSEKKVDPNKYDYKPEWIVFWTTRMKELFNEEVDKKKKEIKMKLGLPENAEEKVDQLKEKYKVQTVRNTAANPTTGVTKTIHRSIERDNNAADVIDISDDENVPHRRSGHSGSRRSHSRSNSRHSSRRNYKRTREKSNSRSPLSVDSEEEDRKHYHRRMRASISHGIHSPRAYHSREFDYYDGPTSSRSRYSSHYGPPPTHYRAMDSYEYSKYKGSPSPVPKSSKAANGSIKEGREPEDDGPLTVIAVLRLLTALEEHLGSLGPKVVDLLGKALALEKLKANSADDLLINDDHCVFFETIKEKLKGLLIADVLEDQQKVRAVKKAIKNIAAIIHQVNTKDNKPNNENDDENGATHIQIKKSENVPKIVDLPFDRQIVATKLAAALVMEGRDDVSTEDMDKLIYLFILLVKLSQNRTEPLKIQDLLVELGLPVPDIINPATALAALPAIVDDLLDNEMSALVQEVEEEISNDTSEKDSKSDANSNMLESLTDSDLQTLLQNFKHLSTEEQHHLIAHLKKLETADPVRVEKLRKFVNVGDIGDSASTSTSKDLQAENSSATDSKDRRYGDSPLAVSKQAATHHLDDEKSDRARGVNPNKFSLDDDEDDDDYNFDEVFKAASSNVNRLSEDKRRSNSKSDLNSTVNASATEPIVPVSSSPNALTFNPAGLNISLSDTQNIIANLMGSLQQSNASQGSNNRTTTHTTKSNAAPKPVPAPPAKKQQTQHHPSQQHQFQQQSQHQQYQHQQQQQQNDQPQMQQAAYYQQHNQPYPGGYNQMDPQSYYNNMGGGGGYNNNSCVGGYPGYDQWRNSQTMPNMPPYGMSNFMPPQQQHPQQQGYGPMYGRGGN